MPSSAASTSASRRRNIAAPSILVASFLVINAADSCQAAPRPVQTHTRQRRADSYADVDDVVPHWEERGIAGKEAEEGWDRRRDERQQWQGSQSGRPTPTVKRRAYTVATASGKSILVPSGFASNIASAWDPGERSIWFQRKAVIICAIFLAIFIVLIIGAAVFLRDKREEDAEEEVDISDEAALKRMRDEREMRKGGGEEKRRKKRQQRQRQNAVDASGNESASVRDAASTTGFVTRWARLPARRLKRRRPKAPSQKSQSTESGQDADQSTALSPRVSMSASNSPDERGASSGSAQASQESDSLHNPPDESMGGSTGLRAPLSVTDLTAAEEAADRQQQQGGHEGDGDVDAFPPAYIPSHRRSSVGQLHPSADRALAAGAAEGTVPRDEKSRSSPPAMLGEERNERDEQAQQSSSAAASSSLPFASNGAPQRSDEYSAHIATDDKTMLGRLRNAASNPSAPDNSVDTAPSYDSASSAPSSSPSSWQAPSAPVPNASAPDLDVTEEEIEAITASTARAKGKEATAAPAADTSALLPAPPQPLSTLAFSRFDMPYSTERPATTLSDAAQDKAQEAQEEQRRALALVESKPEDMAHLPRYERRNSDSMPSAPSAPEDDGDHDGGRSTPLAPALASAPPPTSEA